MVAVNEVDVGNAPVVPTTPRSAWSARQTNGPPDRSRDRPPPRRSARPAASGHLSAATACPADRAKPAADRDCKNFGAAEPGCVDSPAESARPPSRSPHARNPVSDHPLFALLKYTLKHNLSAHFQIVSNLIKEKPCLGQF